MSRKEDVFLAAVIGWALSVVGGMLFLFALGFTTSVLWWAFMAGWSLLK